MNYNYIRYVDYGALSGFCEVHCSSWPGNHVMDAIATSTDIMRLGAVRRKRRSKTINKVFDSISCLSAAQYSKLSVCLVMMDDEQEIRHISHGTFFEGETLVTQCKQHIFESGVPIDHMQKLRDIVSASPPSLAFRLQLDAINCLPAVNVSFNSATCNSRYCVAEGRVRTSCKHLFIRDECTDIKEVQAAGASVIAFKKRGSTRKGIVGSFAAESDDYDSDGCDVNDSLVPIGKRTTFTFPVVEKFKFLLQREGLLRVIKKSDFEVDIIWNKFDTVKSKIQLQIDNNSVMDCYIVVALKPSTFVSRIISDSLCEELATTTITMNSDESTNSVTCIGCTGYADSILYLSEKHGCASLEQSGWCVHTCCSSDVLQVYFKKQQVTNSFLAFTSVQLRANENVTVIRETAAFTKYLVCSDADTTYDHDVSRFAMCVVRSSKKRKFLSCRDVRCKRGKTKRMDNISKLSQVCCHLQVLLKHLHFDLEDDDVLVSDQSDSEGK